MERAERMTPDEWLAEVDANVRKYGIKVGAEDIVKTIREWRGDLHP